MWMNAFCFFIPRCGSTAAFFSSSSVVVRNHHITLISSTQHRGPIKAGTHVCEKPPLEYPPISYKPPIPNPPPEAPPFAAASACNNSETFSCTSKNFAAHRSMHTPSPLLISPSRYVFGMHFFKQDCWSLGHTLAKAGIEREREEICTC
jgi:hypothetical protein